MVGAVTKLGALVFLGAAVGAQPRALTPITMGPISSSDVIEYVIAASSVDHAASIEIRMRVDTSAASAPFTRLVGKRCTAEAGGAFRCLAPVPSQMLGAVNRRGRHAVYAASYAAPVGESAPSAPWFVTS